MTVSADFFSLIQNREEDAGYHWADTFKETILSKRAHLGLETIYELANFLCEFMLREEYLLKIIPKCSYHRKRSNLVSAKENEIIHISLLPSIFRNNQSSWRCFWTRNRQEFTFEARRKTRRVSSFVSLDQPNLN